MASPAIMVLSSLFPRRGTPGAGLFIRERVFRLAACKPIFVVSPQPWFPFQGLIRRWQPGYRPSSPTYEEQQGIRVYAPRFLSVPGVGRRFDGFFIAAAVRWLMWRKKLHCVAIDAHFAYPDGYAATLLGRWLGKPVSITLRGTEPSLAGFAGRHKRIVRALKSADRIVGVSDSLRQYAMSLGADARRTCVIGNGVDTRKFFPIDPRQARAQLALPEDARILVSVGGLVPRKGFHRVIACLPALLKKHPALHYLVVGGGGPEGNMLDELNRQVVALGLTPRVHFLGQWAPEKLHIPLSAADLFVLATSNEGWANVFLEAMGCGLPVITTDVGGNREVVCREALGQVVAFGDQAALTEALDAALSREWDRQQIIQYARENAWDKRVAQLDALFEQLRVAHGATGQQIDYVGTK